MHLHFGLHLNFCFKSYEKKKFNVLWRLKKSRWCTHVFFFFTFLYFFALSFSQGPESGVFTFKDNFIRIVPRKRFYRRKKMDRI